MEQIQTQIPFKTFNMRKILIVSIAVSIALAVGIFLISFVKADATKEDRLKVQNQELTKIELQISDKKVSINKLETQKAELQKQIDSQTSDLNSLRTQREKVNAEKDSIINEGLF